MAARHSASLSERLLARRPEIEPAVLVRVRALDDSRSAVDPEYAAGLSSAVGAALTYGLQALQKSGTSLEPVPSALISQVRRAARARVGLDTVVRRYVAGHKLLDDFIVQEAEAMGTPGGFAQRALRTQAMLLDRLIGIVASEYNGEAEAMSRSWQWHRTECVKRLLGGELTDTATLDYDFGGWHLGVIGIGDRAETVLRGLARDLGCRLLLASDSDRVTWAWLGSTGRPDPDRTRRLASTRRCAGVSLALGEPSPGIEGWRLTHRQAKTAMPLAARDASGIVGYGSVALLTAALQDDVLVRSLHQIYLAPLEDERDGGMVLRQTLGAYLATGRNVSSAAAALGISRQTFKNRLRVAEEKIGRPIVACTAEIETALRLAESSRAE